MSGFREYDPRSWFWIVEDRSGSVWSSAAAIAQGSFAAGYVAGDDEAVAAFTQAGGVATRIASEAELRDLPIAVVSGLTMLGRLTAPEYTAIRQAEAADYAGMGRWLDALRVNGEVNLFGSTAEAAKAGMLQAGLLTQGRADQIFRV